MVCLIVYNSIYYTMVLDWVQIFHSIYSWMWPYVSFITLWFWIGFKYFTLFIHGCDPTSQTFYHLMIFNS